MLPSRCLRRAAAPRKPPTTPRKPFPRSVAVITAIGSVAAFYQYQSGGRIHRNVYAEAHAPAPRFEKHYRVGATPEETRDIISSQHLQVKRSWEHPGVYAWGSNTGKVVAPDSDEQFVKTPRRIPFFDGVLLRDIKLDRSFGAAINEKGDLLQWGTGFDKEHSQPAVTLRGKDLRSLVISRDRIIGLSGSGNVYSVPVAKAEQEKGNKPSESSWVPFLSSTSPIAYRTLEPKSLPWGEKVSALAGGLEHVLLLTDKGRVFSCAASDLDYPSKGQLGIPGLSWNTRPAGPYDQPHEVSTLRGFDISRIAAGDFHSLAADKDGRVFSFGDNAFGQLGFDYDADVPFVDSPALLPVQALYRGTGLTPRVTAIAAGGRNTYFTVDAARAATTTPTSNPADSSNSLAAQHQRRRTPPVTADTWACGQGIYGGLGNGRWTHIQGQPVKIPSLSALFEYSETQNQTLPIRLARLSVGANHAAAVMANEAHVAAGPAAAGASVADTNWGADVVFFGANQHFQIGTGRRNNVAVPTYLAPLDHAAERRVRGKEEHRLQITPRCRVRVNGRSVDLEQRVECGREVTAVYSGV
ncbi:uncharacterized protein K452DRAFT_284852 [Aplosporella prunicola CBS 121167]|uniref:Uncharacterized protein n=1 Tax=Aplosporella prunicola CBS 121167 TaxID=1176127 RepID=A0A6A6BMN5_9PEZI|nr:uncharacterized protein K452DRAFT_284852 [Aplosporella prunicola CBS 121167]KAF2144525.1 hypothetical protein K452DRAFT_284852 [Aplosporella prunicola CBS 121167]